MENNFEEIDEEIDEENDEENVEADKLEEYNKFYNTIKHLVISGGGSNGIQTIGVLQHLEINNFWNINNIETIYATSSGSIISILIALKFDWDMINEYIISRPWHETYQITAEMIFNSYLKKGLFDIKALELFYKPFFNSIDIPLTITMKDFYEYCNIELHFFSLELNSFELINVSYKTFPDIPLLQAILMSCSMPIIFSPVCVLDKCYLDGAIISNYPLKYCIQEHTNKNEILGIRHDCTKNIINNVINAEKNILEYITHFIGKLINSANSKNTETINNECICNTDHLNFSSMKDALYSKDIRKKLLDNGIQDAIRFLQIRL